MQTAPPDPFGLSSDPAGYVARPATERALERLEEALAAGSPVVHLHGPPGMGKTLLLHVLRQRLEGRYRFVYLPYPRMEPGGLWLWVGSALGIPASLDARRGMRRIAAQAREEGGALVVMADEAGMLPAASLRDLVAAAQSEPGLQVLLASLEADDLAGALEPGKPEVRLAQPMSLEETTAYVRARIARLGAPDVLLPRFDAPTLAWLQRESGGIPLLVHALADAVARGAASEPAAAASAPEREPTPPEPGARAPAGAAAEPGAPAPAPPRRSLRRAPALALAALVGLGLGVLAATFSNPGPRLPAALPGATPPTAAGQPAPPEDARVAPGAAGPAVQPVATADTLPPVGAGPPGMPDAGEPGPAAAGAGAAPPGADVPPAAAELAQAAGPPQPAPRPESALPEPSATSVPQPPSGAAGSPAHATAEEPAPAAAPARVRSRPRGLLHVRAPQGGIVSVDGRIVGPAPIEPLPLRQGTHRVRVRLSDGIVAQRTVELGEDGTVTFYPPQDDPPTSPGR